MTDNLPPQDDREARVLSERADQGEWHMYGEPDVGLEAAPFVGRPLKGDMHPIDLYAPENAAFICAAVNFTRAAFANQERAPGVDEALRSAAGRYMKAVEALGENPPGRKDTYFEAPLLETDDGVFRWEELNDAGKALANALSLSEQSS